MLKPEELSANTIRLTPRRGLFAQMLAVWSTGGDVPLATFIWNVATEAAIAHQAEIDLIVAARAQQDGSDYQTAFNALVRESGMFTVTETENPAD